MNITVRQRREDLLAQERGLRLCVGSAGLFLVTLVSLAGPLLAGGM